MNWNANGIMTVSDAGAAIEPYRFVRFNSSQDAVYCDAGEFPLGWVGSYTASGENTPVDLPTNRPGTLLCEAAGAISARADVYTAADGKISATNSGVKVGVALAAASGSGSVIEVLPEVKRVAMVNVAASAVIGATSTAAADFDKTFTIPAAELKAGSIIRIRAAGIVVDQDSTPACSVKLYLGTELVATATVAAAADNDQFAITADLVVRVIGASGKVFGLVASSFDAAATGLVTSLLAEATEDTTSGLAVKLTGEFAASHGDNKVRLDLLSVEHIR